MTRSRSPSERRAMFARMGKDYHAMNRDMSVRAANTLPDTPENREEWVKDSRRIDIEGIDTPPDMKTVLTIQPAKPYPDDLMIGSREEFYDEKFLYDPDRGRHPASGSGRLPTKHVPFYEVVDVGGKNKWRVVNPYTGEIKYYPYGEHNAAKAYYDGMYDDYLKSKSAPNNNIKINWIPLSDSDSIVLMSPTEYIERIGIVNRLGSKDAVEEREKAAKEKGYPGILHYPGYSKESVKSIISGYREGKEIYMPQIMYDEKGLVDDQEGYHRAIAAIEMNIKQIPVAVYGNMPLKYEKTHDYRKEIKMLGD